MWSLIKGIAAKRTTYLLFAALDETELMLAPCIRRPAGVVVQRRSPALSLL